MIPLTMYDTTNYLELSLTFKNGAKIDLFDTNSCVSLNSNPELSKMVLNDDFSIIDLSNILWGEDSFKLIDEFNALNLNPQDIETIDWNLVVRKDESSIFTLEKLFTNRDICEVILEAFELLDNNFNEVSQELYEFLSSILEFEIYHGFNFDDYFNNALKSRDITLFYPKNYEVIYHYSLDLINNFEEFVIDFIKDPLN